MSLYASHHFCQSINTISYSTHYRDVCCIGTFDLNNWYHGGKIHICQIAPSQFPTEERPTIKSIANMDNKIGIHKLVWSEVFKELIATANDDGCRYTCQKTLFPM